MVERISHCKTISFHPSEAPKVITEILRYGKKHLHVHCIYGDSP